MTIKMEPLSAENDVVDLMRKHLSEREMRIVSTFGTMNSFVDNKDQAVVDQLNAIIGGITKPFFEQVMPISKMGGDTIFMAANLFAAISSMIADLEPHPEGRLVGRLSLIDVINAISKSHLIIDTFEREKEERKAFGRILAREHSVVTDAIKEANDGEI